MSKDIPQPNAVPSGPRPDLIAFAMILMMGVTWGLSFSWQKSSASRRSPVRLHMVADSGFRDDRARDHAHQRVRMPITKAHLIYYLVCGFVGIAIPNFINLTALAHLPAGLMAVLINTVPLMTYCLAIVFSVEKYRPSVRRCVGWFTWRAVDCRTGHQSAEPGLGRLGLDRPRDPALICRQKHLRCQSPTCSNPRARPRHGPNAGCGRSNLADRLQRRHVLYAVATL